MKNKGVKAARGGCGPARILMCVVLVLVVLSAAVSAVFLKNRVSLRAAASAAASSPPDAGDLQGPSPLDAFPGETFRLVEEEVKLTGRPVSRLRGEQGRGRGRRVVH